MHASQQQLQIFFFQVLETISAQDLPHFVGPDVAQAPMESVYSFSELLGLDGQVYVRSCAG
jgi:hypothetical protein